MKILTLTSARPISTSGFFKSQGRLLSWFSNFVSGFIFGYAISVGLGLTPFSAVVLASIAGVGLLLSGSLTSYLLIQTIFLAAMASLTLFVFRFIPSLVIDASAVQSIYSFGLALTPLLALIPRLRKGLGKLHSTSVMQLYSTSLFAFLVLNLRDRMPADSGHAMTALYGMEDNAGIAEKLSMSLESGFTSHVSSLGEFSNGVYLAAAGITSALGSEPLSPLIAVYTHWNMTLLFLAWLPLTATAAVVFSGRKLKTSSAIVVITTISVTLALLLWPFIGFGHTSVISSSLFAVVLLSLTLNRKLACDNPWFFLSLTLSLGFVIGNIWFPFMPFAAAVVMLAFISLLQAQYKKGNKATVFSISGVLVIVALGLAPIVVNLVSQRDSLILETGATRSASTLLILLWLGLVCLAVLVSSKGRKSKTLIADNFFVLSILTLLASNVYLVTTGMIVNGGYSAYGYGANKYLITSIAMSIPVLWLAWIGKVKHAPTSVSALTGLALAFSLLIVQPDHGLVVNSGVISTSSEQVTVFESAVVTSIRSALETKPDHILCVSDLGYPAIVEGRQWNDDQWSAYLCTRWGDSLAGKATIEGHYWKSTMINSLPESTLAAVRDVYQDKKVAIIRFPAVDEESLELSDFNNQWWIKYVNPSWQIFNVEK